MKKNNKSTILINGITKVLTMILRGLKFEDGKTGVAVQPNVIIKQKAMI